MALEGQVTEVRQSYRALEDRVDDIKADLLKEIEEKEEKLKE